jgi:hypothetical protein
MNSVAQDQLPTQFPCAGIPVPAIIQVRYIDRRHCVEQATIQFRMPDWGLLRFARNDSGPDDSCFTDGGCETRYGIIAPCALRYRA